MVQIITENVYRIGVPLPGNPLRELGSYLIRAERDLLIDTGFRMPECREALLQGLQELGSRRESRDVYVTHYHADHLGLAGEMAAEDGRIYMSRQDLTYYRDIFQSGAVREQRSASLLAEGFPPRLMAEFFDHDASTLPNVERVDKRFCAVEDGTQLHYGGHDLRVLLVPGHTPGHTMLWDERGGIMFTGDHVLFGISPNITAWYGVPDSLGDYLDSLRRVRDYPVCIALPGHRDSGDYTARVDALLAHHERRIQEALRIVCEHPGQPAYEIAALMRWKLRAKSWEDFPVNQKFFATGECIAHLDYMRARGMVMRTKCDGIWRYTAL